MDTVSQPTVFNGHIHSRRDSEFQLTYPGTRVSTLQEVFEFAECADPSHQVLWNIESKINAKQINQTRGVEDFVQKQHAIFTASPYKLSITVSIKSSVEVGLV